MPSVRIAEFHYDNPGTDANERIEISGPAGTDLTGWSIVRYNGANPASAVTYSSPGNPTVGGTIPATCGTRGVIVIAYPQDGLQNGGNDGFALVDNTGAVVEFLSYEGVATASNGPAAGMTSVDVGVSETGLAAAPAVSSIQRQPDGSWILATGTAVNFGACNDDNSGIVTPVAASVTVAPATPAINQGSTQQFTATVFDASNTVIPGAPVTWSASPSTVATITTSGLASGVGAGTATITATSGSASGTATLTVNAVAPYVPPNIRFSEIHYDNGGTDVGEAIEIEGPINTALSNWSIVLYDGGNGGHVYNTVAVNGTLAGTCNSRGVISIPIAGIQNGPNDGFALVDGNGQLVEFLSYEGTLTAADGIASGLTSRDIGAAEAGTENAGLSLHRSADGLTWSGPTTADFGFVNACGGPPPASITFSGRSPTSDPALPVGFEGQVFASETVGGNNVNTTFTWSSDTPTIASVDQNGVFRSLTPGTAIIRATATDGATATISYPMSQGTQSSVVYKGNTEFGIPTDNDASDYFIVVHPEYTSSYNKNKGHPNWVSLRLDASNYGVQDRCNCFTFDPELDVAGFTHLTTNDYTGAGAAAGFGIDRGHMARSADRTASDLDNAFTYYFSNVLPQAAAVNQGPWADEETVLGNMAKAGKEVYVISGGAGTLLNVKGQGKIEMPASVWKVALIMDNGKGLADVHTVNDVQIIAVIMPNTAAVNTDWTVYKTTLLAVEQLSGYNLFSLLPPNIKLALETNDTPPVARATGPGTGNEGSSLSFCASASSDADVGDVLTYAWTFGDGGTATGVNPSHTYADNGTYTVTMTVKDSKGVTDQTTLTVNVANVAPVITGITPPAGAVRVNTAALFTVSFTDAGVLDTHAPVVTWGDGTQNDYSVVTGGFRTGTSRGLVHAYAQAGVYTVGVTILDNNGGSATQNTTVVVYNPAPGSIASDGTIPTPSGNSVMHAAVTYNVAGTAAVGSFTLTTSPDLSALTSTSFDYLLISNNVAFFQGKGTLSDGRTVGFYVRGLDRGAGARTSTPTSCVCGCGT